MSDSIQRREIRDALRLVRLSFVYVTRFEFAASHLFNYFAAIGALRRNWTLRRLSLGRISYRAWYYFRMGYATYLTYLVGYVSTLITVYYLAIKSVPTLLEIFPRFVPFSVLATVIGVPLSVGIGWVHLKRSTLYSSEADIGQEANPYVYKLPKAGIQMDAQIPSELFRLRLLKKLADANGLLTDAERLEIEKIEANYQTLLSGGSVGIQRRH